MSQTPNQTNDQIVIDTSIYNTWPEKTDGCYVVIDEDESSPNTLMLLLKNNNFEPGTINYISAYKEYFTDEIISYMKWQYDETENAIVTAIVVKDEYQNSGIGTFMCILARTWVAENKNYKIVAEKNNVFPAVEHILSNIIEEYGENSSPYADINV